MKPINCKCQQYIIYIRKTGNYKISIALISIDNFDALQTSNWLPCSPQQNEQTISKQNRNES